MDPERLRKKIIELTGEDPEDMFGPDWENYAEEYLDEHDDYAMKFGPA